LNENPPQTPGFGRADESSGLPEAQPFLVEIPVRNIVYGEKIQDLRHIRVGIRAAIGTLTPDRIQHTWHQIN
jgi:hypothetical protein